MLRGVYRRRVISGSFKAGRASGRPRRAVVLGVMVLGALCVGLWLLVSRHAHTFTPRRAPAAGSAHGPVASGPHGSAVAATAATPTPASPGQGRATIETVAGAGSVSGR